MLPLDTDRAQACERLPHGRQDTCLSYLFVKFNDAYDLATEGVTQQFVHQLHQDNNNILGNSTFGEYTADQYIPPILTKGQWYGDISMPCIHHKDVQKDFPDCI